MASLARRNWAIILLLSLSFILRAWRLDYPNEKVWDESYYTVTALGILNHNPGVWDYTLKRTVKRSPDQLFTWEHPQLAEEIMDLFIIVSTKKDYYIFRLPGVILGTVSIFLVYLIGLSLFKNKTTALIAALLLSLDGLNFILSRTAMLEIYTITFSLASLALFLRKRFIFSAIFLGLALASKWTAVSLFPLYLVLIYKEKIYSKIVYFLLVPFIVYISTYLPFFMAGHNLLDLFRLFQQQLHYQTNLHAVDGNSSPWWAWPLIIKPIWFYWKFYPTQIAIILAAGGSLYWLGLASVFYSIYDFFKNRSFGLLVCILGFLFFWLPWAISPRTTYSYYFASAVPFLCLILAYSLTKLLQVKSGPFIVKAVVFLVMINFVIFFPFFSGIPLPKDLVNLFFRVNN